MGFRWREASIDSLVSVLIDRNEFSNSFVSFGVAEFY
ncbi:hypothetical protein Pan258_07690 [Symmachiella dynata]|nr:hypothetical protein Pan258_07690 [Symmachiella dynata]